jgi:hypothetical protein
VAPVSDNVTGDDAGVVATGPALAPGFDEPPVEFEPQAAATKTHAAANPIPKRTLMFRTFFPPVILGGSDSNTKQVTQQPAVAEESRDVADCFGMLRR